MSRRVLVLALLVVGLAASLYVTIQRARVESRNGAVEIVLDYDELRQVAAATGADVVDVMRKFASVGATSVAVTEETFETALRNGSVQPRNGVYVAGPTYGDRIDRALRRNLPDAMKSAAHSPRIQRFSGTSFISPGTIPPDYFARLPLGLSDEALEQVKTAGLKPVARLVNYPGVTPEAIRLIVEEVKSQGIDRIIFSGDQVLGFKGAVKETARALVDNGVYVGRIEFSKQKGEMKLAENAEPNLLIVHSVAQDEMLKLDRPSVVERFQRAVRERGVRMLYVRMYETASEDILADNLDYVRSITGSLAKAGYQAKNSRPFEEIAVPNVMSALAGVGVAAGSMLLLLAIINPSPVAFAACLAVLVVACAGMAGVAEIGRKAVALLSALVFPILAVINATRNAPETQSNPPRLLAGTIDRFLMAVLTASAGGLLIVGLLSERSFMLRIDQFMGVKLAHMLPVIILAGLYTLGIAWKSGTWREQREALVSNAKAMASNPILIGQAVGLLVVVAIVGLMVARSGNDSGVGVSPLELKFRSVLDKVLYVRPRTKEFLIGYPALFVGIAFALRGIRRWAAPLVVVGSIGLISALNTFCHIHTPVELSIFRVINGTLVGGIIGLLAYRLARGGAKQG